jgi:hypothetical protein
MENPSAGKIRKFGLIPSRIKKVFVFSEAARPALVPLQPYIQWIPKLFSSI